MKNKISIIFISFFMIAFSCINALATSYGGGGGSVKIISDIKTYTYSTDGTPLTDEPADGTEIDLTIQVKFKNEFCSYAVAVYDNEMRLISTKLHTPDNTNRLESEFISLRTKYYSNGEICIFKVEDFNNFNAVENKTKKYFNLSGDKIPEMVYFSGWDIMSYDESSLTVSANNENQTYKLTNNTVYVENYNPTYKFNPDNDYYSAEVIDGNIVCLYSANTSMIKIVTVNDSYIVDVLGDTYETDNIISYSGIKKGDVAVIDRYKNKYRLTKAKRISGVITPTEEYYELVTDDTSYEFETQIDYNYFSGEHCFGYTNYYDNQIRLLEKDYSKKAPIFVTDYKDNYLYAYGSVFNENELINLRNIPLNSFKMYFLTNANNGKYYIESMPEICSGRFTYNYVTNSINGYTLDENTKVFGFGSTLNMIMPKQGYTYNMRLYSGDGIHIDYVIYEDPTDSAVCEDVYMLVDEFKYNSFFGYVDGKYKVIKSDIESFEYQCAYVKLSVNKNTDKVVRYSIIFANDSFGQDKTNTSTSGVTELPVSEITGGVITLTNNNNRYPVRISDDTKIYEYHRDDDFLDIAELQDIYYNPVYPSQSDRVIIYYTNSIADTIIIIR